MFDFYSSYLSVLYILTSGFSFIHFLYFFSFISPGLYRCLPSPVLSIYESVLPRLKSGTITGSDQAILVKLYNKVFNANKKPSGCSSCVQQTLAKLAKVYVNSCKNEE